MGKPTSHGKQRQRWRRTLLRLWLAGSIVWCALVALLAYSEWQAYRRAAFSFELGLQAETELPNPPPPGFHLVELTAKAVDPMGPTGSMILFFVVVAILPPACALALGWLAHKAGAL